MSGNLAYGRSKSNSEQNSYNMGSTVWEPQANYLTDMYGGVNNTYNQQQGNVFNPQTGAWEGTGQPSPEYAQAQNYMAAMGGAYGQANSAINNGYNAMDAGLQNMQSANPNFSQAEGAFNQAMQGYNQGYGQLAQANQGFNSFMNPGVNPMQDVYRQQISQAFNEDILPQLQGQQMLNGGYGGSRGQIGEALAGARSSQQLQNFSAELYNQDMNRKLAAAQGIASLGDAYGNLAGGQGNIGQGFSSLGSARVNQGQAMGNIGDQMGGLSQHYQNNAAGMGGLAEMGMALPWYNLQQYAGLLGKPTTRQLPSYGQASSRGSDLKLSGGGGMMSGGTPGSI